MNSNYLKLLEQLNLRQSESEQKLLEQINSKTKRFDTIEEFKNDLNNKIKLFKVIPEEQLSIVEMNKKINEMVIDKFEIKKEELNFIVLNLKHIISENVIEYDILIIIDDEININEFKISKFKDLEKAQKCYKMQCDFINKNNVASIITHIKKSLNKIR